MVAVAAGAIAGEALFLGKLAVAEPGQPGQGGQASGNVESGYGGAGGPAPTGQRDVCKGSDRVRTPANAGDRGQDGYRAAPGPGGDGGEPPVIQQGCPGAGRGGMGGNGAGMRQNLSVWEQIPSSSGLEGWDGCVVLTYTP